MSRRSRIWEHFSIIAKEKARCDYCQNIISFSGGGSSNLGRHIRAKHRDLEDYGPNNKTPNKRKLRSKRSKVWKYFTAVSYRKAKCCFCLKLISFSGGGTTNLGRHIRLKHRSISLDSITTASIPPHQNCSDPKLSDSENVPNYEVSEITTASTSQLMSSLEQIKIWSHERDLIPLSNSKQIDEQLTKMIVKQYYPLNMVEDPNFKEFIHTLCSNYKLPTEKTISRMLIPHMFEEVKHEIKNLLERAEAVCLATKIWTSNSQRSYIGITAHFLNNLESKISLQSCLLACIPCNTSPKSDSLAILLRKEVESWNLEEKIVCVITDNTPDIVRAVRSNNWRHLPSFERTLNIVSMEGLAVIESEIDKIRNIIEYFNVSSKATNLLSAMQNELSLPEIKLKQDNTLDWSSTYEMISRATRIKDAVVAILAIDRPELESLTDREWKVLEGALKVFKVFDVVAKEMSTEGNFTLSKIMLIINVINTHLIKMSQENTYDEVTAIIKTLQNSVSQRFKEIESNALVTAATILDPRFKRYGFTSQTDFDRSLENFKQDFEFTAPIVSENISKNTALQTQLEISLIWDEFDTKVENDTSTLWHCEASTNEVDKYLSEPLIKRTEDPLKWWDDRKHIYPQLYKMVHHLFCIVSTSIPCERAFSKAELLYDERCSSFKPETMAQCIFLNYNL